MQTVCMDSYGFPWILFEAQKCSPISFERLQKDAAANPTKVEISQALSNQLQ